MIWKQMIKDLDLQNEKEIFELMKRKPADPVIYLMKVQDTINLDIQVYYKILMKKCEEEGNRDLFKVARELEYIIRDDRERKKDW